ncbi:hypothetical protein HYX10_01035 [Candidatus Woesearchaeota archaeon]|nr:hypothetical protein [Candidatus Woesearchaeota archaeon]
MNRKKLSAAGAAAALLAAFALFLVGRLNYMVFLLVAGAAAIFAYKILPRMK